MGAWRRCALTGALLSLLLVVVGADIGGPQSGTPTQRAAAPAASSRRNIPYADAQRLFDELRPDLIPADLRGHRSSSRRSEWPRWVATHDAQIRARLLHGYEDSVVNLLFFGTRFTRLSRLTSGDIDALPEKRSALVEGRLEDLITAVGSPGTNGRLLFVRSMLERHGANPATAAGLRDAHAYIASLMNRFAADRSRYDRTYRSAKQFDDPSATLFTQSTLYRDRGLSSDTSIFPDFALDITLSELRSAGLLAPGSVRHVGIVGPGLDFVDKDEGYDFYPQQTIQPFVVADSLTRLGLVMPGALQTTTFDLNPRVTGHLEAARLRAAQGDGYVLQFARSVDEHWLDALAGYWQRAGTSIGEETKPVAPPANAGRVAVRAVRIPPSVVLSVGSRDLNIVLQRVELPRDQQFDVVVATNILVYYDVFEQSLALQNVARMLRPGGLFLTNHVVLSSPSMMMAGYTDVPYTDAGDGDRVWWYQKQ
jgi:Methyltransferase domain